MSFFCEYSSVSFFLSPKDSVQFIAIAEVRRRLLLFFQADSDKKADQEGYSTIYKYALYEKKIFDYIYLICGKEKSYLADNIIKISNKNYFINCSSKNLNGIIFALKNSN